MTSNKQVLTFIGNASSDALSSYESYIEKLQAMPQDGQDFSNGQSDLANRDASRNLSTNSSQATNNTWNTNSSRGYILDPRQILLLATDIASLQLPGTRPFYNNNNKQHASQIYKARILSRSEEIELLKGVDTTGYAPKRLKKVINFIKAGYSALADDEPDWLITSEEEQVKDRIEELLDDAGACMACQIGAIAVRALRRNPALLAGYAKSCVCISHFEMLDKATQELCAMLAKHTLVIHADPSCAKTFIFEYPEHDFWETLDKNFCLQSIFPSQAAYSLPPEPARNQNEAAANYQNAQSCTSKACSLKANAATLSSAIQMRAQALKSQQADAIHAAIKAPINILQAQAAKNTQDIASHSSEGLMLLECGSPSEELAAIAPLCNNTWKAKRSIAITSASKMWLNNAASALSAAGFNITRKAPKAHSEQMSTVAYILSPQEIELQQFHVVVFGAFIDGIIPTRAYFDNAIVGKTRVRAQIEELSQIYTTLQSAQEALIFTSFKSCALEAAERLDAKIERIKLIDGLRVAKTRSSSYLKA